MAVHAEVPTALSPKVDMGCPALRRCPRGSEGFESKGGFGSCSTHGAAWLSCDLTCNVWFPLS
eukprot:6369483-Amphidinium_carterae.1